MDPTVLLDSYAAKTCPYALHLDRVAPQDARLDVGEAAAERIAAGNVFEAIVGERIDKLGVNVVAIPNGRHRDDDPEGWAADRAERLDLTVAAIEAGVAVIWNPRLPPDPSGHRSGEPDLLLRAHGEGGATYFPVDVKAHHALIAAARQRGGALSDLVSDLGPTITAVGPAESAHREDLLQLAHYWRMLESLDRAPAGPPTGAIIGWSGQVEGDPIVGWFVLGTVMDEYRAAFDSAVVVVDRAVAVAAGAELPPLGRPWYAESCHECGWRGVCGPELVEVRHVSLVRPNRRIRGEIEALGVETIDVLADIAPTTVRPDGRAIGESAARREAIGRARMARGGDPLPFTFLPEVGGETHPVPRLWRRPDAPTAWTLSRRAVELDVDMESTPTGVYLWGTLLSYPDGLPPFVGLAEGYRGFGERFAAPGDETTVAVFLEFLDFVATLRDACERSGRSLGMYCYAGPSAEEPAMRRCAAVAERASGSDEVVRWVEELLADSVWIDLLDEIRARVVSLNGLGLKIVARATGFEWRAEDAGGEASMRWYERATADPDPAVRAEHRAKILAYNEDDVAATRHLREWFDHNAPDTLPLVP